MSFPYNFLHATAFPGLNVNTTWPTAQNNIAAAMAAMPPLEVAMNKPSTSKAVEVSTTPRTVTEEDEEHMPWEDCDWVPTMSNGKQKTPNQIRGELQRYLDSCGRTQTSVVQDLQVNNNSFRKFMNPKTYKDQWSALQNGTYWAAARFLAQLAHDNKTKKRKGTVAGAASDTTTSTGPAKKKVKTESRAEADAWLLETMAVTLLQTGVVFGSCPQVVQKIKQCLTDHPGLTKASFCKVALEGVNHNSLARFLAGKKQDQQGNVVYKRAYAFFEKLRIKNGEAKSKARLKNESEQGPGGFDTAPYRPCNTYYIVAGEVLPPGYGFHS